MVPCGCTPQEYACEEGKRLCIDAWCGKELIEGPLFLSRSQQEREEIWQHYQEAVEAYLRHCGYSGVGNGRS